MLVYHSPVCIYVYIFTGHLVDQKIMKLKQEKSHT